MIKSLRQISALPMHVSLGGVAQQNHFSTMHLAVGGIHIVQLELEESDRSSAPS